MKRGEDSDSLCILISTVLHFSNCVCFLLIINILYSSSRWVHHLNRKAFSSAVLIQFKDVLQAWDYILNWCKIVQPHWVWGSRFPLHQQRFCFHYRQKKPPGPPGSSPRCTASSQMNSGLSRVITQRACADRSLMLHSHSPRQSPWLILQHVTAKLSCRRSWKWAPWRQWWQQIPSETEGVSPCCWQHIPTTDDGNNIGVRFIRDIPPKLASEHRL